MDPPFTVEYLEEENVVEIYYDGMNNLLLKDLIDRVVIIEGEIESDNTNNELEELEEDINSLATIVQAQGSALTVEISNREQGDYSLAEHTTNELINQQQEYSRMIEAEAEIRAQAILDEATARGAAIAESEAIIMTDVAILATTVEGLATEMGAAQASIIEVNDALVTETMARTAQYTVMQADYGDTNAAIMEESVARSDTDTALAYAISLLEAGAGEINAAILVERLARIEQDEALAADIVLVTAKTNENTAAISQETLARTTKDEALAQEIDALEVTVGNVSGSVTQEASARIEADQSINAKYSVKVATNGKVSGFDLISTANVNETPYSKFVFNADSFQIFNGVADLPPFEVTGGIVYMQNVKIVNAVIDNLAITNRTIDVLAVETPKVQGNAISTKASAAYPEYTTTNSTSVSVGLTVTGLSNVTVWVSGYLKASGAAAQMTVSFILKRDGVTLYTWSDSDPTTVVLFGTFIYEDTLPPAGYHTYSVSFVGGGDVTPVSHSRAIVCMEMKK